PGADREAGTGVRAALRRHPRVGPPPLGRGTAVSAHGPLAHRQETRRRGHDRAPAVAAPPAAAARHRPEGTPMNPILAWFTSRRRWTPFAFQQQTWDACVAGV